jgi:hypothetical protein
MTFDEVMAAHTWKAIRNCPGRFVLASGPSPLQPTDILGPGASCQTFRVDAARDLVVVARIDDGGLISYQRGDGHYLHTLNTPEGFARKLEALEIAIG